MESKKFDNFEEASSFAKSLAQEGVMHNLKRKGASWIVEHDKPQASPQPKETDVQPLLKKVKVQASKIEDLEQTNSDLQAKVDALVSNIHEQVAEEVENNKKALEAERRKLTEALSRVKAKEAGLAVQKSKLALLEKEYAAFFGEAEVQIVKERVTSKEICPRCSGDGGVKGGCKKCDGTGWIDATREEPREVLKIKGRKRG